MKKEESMRHFHRSILALCAAICLFTTGCTRRNNSGVWDDNATTGNYKSSERSLWGHDEISAEENFFAASEGDFIPLQDEDLQTQFVDGAIPLAKNSPGEKGSVIPSIDGFHRPTGSESAVFKTVHFNTDDHILRGHEELEVIERIVSYLDAHPDVYLFVSGNCDERGPEAYNLSLGARRANYVRTLLVQKGVDGERIHTVSYGKERPIDSGHSAESWKKNRRADFMIYQK